MSEAALWLGCGLATAVAFLLTYFRNWRVVPAVFVGAAATLVTCLVVASAGAGVDDPFRGGDLVNGTSLGVIFAAVGAAAGLAMKRKG